MDVSEQTFAKEVLERSTQVPVVVDFWAAWCAPCRLLGPVLERAVAERAGQVFLAKIDVDANSALAARYGIRGIPAIKAFRSGRVVREFVGVQSPQSVAAFLDSLLGPTETEKVVADLRETGDSPEALAALERGDYEQALEILLAEVRSAGRERREHIRRLMVALFGDLGQDHPLSARYRRELATALY